MTELQTGVRVDKWLWAARFFKHRTAATDAVVAGHVRINGLQIKPSHLVKVNDRVELVLHDDTRHLLVKDLAEKRGSTARALSLYVETVESVEAREHRRAMRKLQREPAQEIQGRPTKKDRRQMNRWLDRD